MNKKKVVVVGNCQARPIASLLEKMSDEIEVTKIAIVHLLQTEQESEYKKNFEEADYILTQVIADNYPCEFVTTRDLRGKYGGKVVTIVNLFSKKQHPDWIYLRDDNRKHLLGPLQEYHNLTIIKCWFFEKTISETKAIMNHAFLNSYLYASEGEQSFKQLREKESVADVKIHDFIAKTGGGFWTFNHPKSQLLTEYTNRIFKVLTNKNPKDIKQDSEPLDKVKIPSNIMHERAIDYEDFEVKGKKYTQDDIIEKFFEVYNNNKSLVSGYMEQVIKKSYQSEFESFYYSFSGIESLSLSLDVKGVFEEFVITVENNFLHLSNVMFEVGGEWYDLRSDLVKEVVASSTHLDQERFSVSALIDGRSKFFSTKNEKESSLRIILHDKKLISKIKIVNRPEYSLWSRVQSVRITAINGKGWTIVYDNRNILNTLQVLLKVINDLEVSLGNERFQAELSVLKFCVSNYEVTGILVVKCAILDIIDKVYLLAFEDIKQFNDAILAIESLILYVANSGFLLESQEAVTVLISYLVLKGQLKNAFLIYKNICSNWNSDKIQEIKIVIDNIGQFKYGYSLVPASHSFARPIRDWPKNLVFNTIDSIIKCTEIETVKCSFVCYGTLLGLYRDGDFIVHDDDIDILCVVDGDVKLILSTVEVIKQNLIELGFKVKEAKANDKNDLPFLMIFDPKHGIHSDLFFGYIDSGNLYLPMTNVRYAAINVDEILPLSTYTVLGKSFSVPKNIEYFLAERYGSSWDIPDEFFRVREK